MHIGPPRPLEQSHSEPKPKFKFVFGRDFEPINEADNINKIIEINMKTNTTTPISSRDRSRQGLIFDCSILYIYVIDQMVCKKIPCGPFRLSSRNDASRQPPSVRPVLALAIASQNFLGRAVSWVTARTLIFAVRWSSPSSNSVLTILKGWRTRIRDTPLYCDLKGFTPSES
jgi:hypothetical protein